MLIANLGALTEALAFGKTPAQVEAEGTPKWPVPHRVFEGNRQSQLLGLQAKQCFAADTEFPWTRGI